MTPVFVSLEALCLAVLLSAAQVHARTRYIHTTNTVCYNEQGQRIGCPFHWTPLYIVLVTIGGFVVLCAILAAIFKCSGSRRKNRSLEAKERTTSGWRWPWSRKYKKVSDPEGTSGSLREEPMPTILEPEPYDSGYLKHSEPRASEDSYYVPPQLGYDYKSTPTSGLSIHSASSSVTSFPKPDSETLAPSYDPPAYAPPSTYH